MYMCVCVSRFKPSSGSIPGFMYSKHSRVHVVARMQANRIQPSSVGCVRLLDPTLVCDLTVDLPKPCTIHYKRNPSSTLRSRGLAAKADPNPKTQNAENLNPIVSCFCNSLID